MPTSRPSTTASPSVSVDVARDSAAVAAEATILRHERCEVDRWIRLRPIRRHLENRSLSSRLDPSAWPAVPRRTEREVDHRGGEDGEPVELAEDVEAHPARR